MLLYAKITKYTIPLAVLMVAVFSVFPAGAASLDFTYDFSNLHHIALDYSNTSIGTALTDLSNDPDSKPLISYPVSFNFDLYQSNYSTQLYSNGIVRLSVNIPVFFYGVTPTNTNIDFTYDAVSAEGVHFYISKVAYYQATDGPYIRINLYAYLDNAFVPKSNTVSFSNITVNCNINAILPVEPDMTAYRMQIGNATFDNPLFRVSTSVTPETTGGQAAVIAEAVTFGIYNSSLDELLEASNSQLNSANTNLSTVISVLNSIKTQDLSLYNEIISKIVAQTQNDTALQQAFIQYLTAQLRGQSSIYDPYSGSGQFVFVDSPIGDIVARIWNELTNFRIIFTDYIYSNQSEAADVNSDAASQVSALSDLQQSLVVPTPAVDGVLDELASDFQDSEIESGQSNVFYFLRHSYIVKIIAFAFSLGLAGFILYGKG